MRYLQTHCFWTRVPGSTALKVPPEPPKIIYPLTLYENNLLKKFSILLSFPPFANTEMISSLKAGKLFRLCSYSKYKFWNFNLCDLLQHH